MTTVSKTITSGGLLAAMGLNALSPVHQAGVALSVGGGAIWAAPALAGKVKGKITAMGDKGTVIRQKSDDSYIIAPTDSDGIVRMAGLKPGDYEVKLLGSNAPVTMTVGRDSRLAFVALREVKGGPDPESADPRARRALPVVTEWVEPTAFGGAKAGGATVFVLNEGPCPKGMICEWSIIDVNTASADQLMRGTNNSPQTAAFIVGEREKNGTYKTPLDFVQRVGGSVDVDFDVASIRMGDTMIMARGGEPKAAGWKTFAGSGEVEVYGRKWTYVGHVTLLR